jgi:hypothetical protein
MTTDDERRHLLATGLVRVAVLLGLAAAALVGIRLPGLS